MLNAHMDEVGMTVTYIEDNGLLRFCYGGRHRPPGAMRQARHRGKRASPA